MLSFRSFLKKRGILSVQQRFKVQPVRHVRYLAACLIIATVFLLLSCKSEKKVSAPPTLVVTVMEVVQKDVPVAFEYVAQTQSSQLVNINARVSGFLDKRMYTEGAVVKAGYPSQVSLGGQSFSVKA